MTTGEAIVCVLVLIWLAGIGLLASAMHKAMAEDEIAKLAMRLFPEKLALVVTLMVVSWPLSLPVAVVTMKARKGK